MLYNIVKYKHYAQIVEISREMAFFFIFKFKISAMLPFTFYPHHYRFHLGDDLVLSEALCL